MKWLQKKQKQMHKMILSLTQMLRLRRTQKKL